MTSASLKKRKFEERVRERTARPKKRVRKQKEYHSSSEDSDGSEDGFTPVNLNDSDEDESNLPSKERKDVIGPTTGTSSDNSASGNSEDEDSSGDNGEGDERNEQRIGADRKKSVSKRNDPKAFSTSISKILSTKLSQSARRDPVLSRSREAAEVSGSLANEKLERKAKAKLRADRKEELDRGRVKDVLGLNTGEAGETADEEKKLRKIAQRGVVKLFNAVRAAQVRGEEAAREERKKGTVGITNREQKVNEMSKQGFLDLINSKKAKGLVEA